MMASWYKISSAMLPAGSQDALTFDVVHVLVLVHVHGHEGEGYIGSEMTRAEGKHKETQHMVDDEDKAGGAQSWIPRYVHTTRLLWTTTSSAAAKDRSRSTRLPEPLLTEEERSVTPFT